MTIDHEYTDDPVCPYCGYQDKDWCEWLWTDEDGEQDCGSCSETYLWHAERSVTWLTRKKV